MTLFWGGVENVKKKKTGFFQTFGCDGSRCVFFLPRIPGKPQGMMKHFKAPGGSWTKLVGGFNPIEKYESKWKSSPNRDENKKYLKPPPSKPPSKPPGCSELATHPRYDTILIWPLKGNDWEERHFFRSLSALLPVGRLKWQKPEAQGHQHDSSIGFFTNLKHPNATQVVEKILLFFLELGLQFS